jgi:hypothetical protein
MLQDHAERCVSHGQDSLAAPFSVDQGFSTVRVGSSSRYPGTLLL